MKKASLLFKILGKKAVQIDFGLDEKDIKKVEEAFKILSTKVLNVREVNDKAAKQ